MTSGQERALRELKRLEAIDSEVFEIIGTPEIKDTSLIAQVSLRLGAMDSREGGLALMEREKFILAIPPDFPFQYPSLKVFHNRFRGFPHVIWGRTLCLYQSKVEWNPADGLYGYFDRLRYWLGKAALNDMDPIEGPLEPPHYGIDSSQAPFIVRANAPATAGDAWIGLAELEKHSNRTELVGWNDSFSNWPTNRVPALAVFLAAPLPMEFPSNAAEFFEELQKAGLERIHLLRRLALAALLSPENEPTHLVLGLPMRRGRDGSTRIHIAVWTTESTFRKFLISTLPDGTDSEEIATLREDLANSLYTVLEKTQISWVRVMEDRSEIVVRRDSGTPIQWFSDKKILILGCGALGSWIAEFATRARPNAVHLVDNAVVTPGVLSRQNYSLDDIGIAKSDALSKRLRSLIHGCSIEGFAKDAWQFVMEKGQELAEYDVVLDCTASHILQMKLERDWGKLGPNPPRFISFVIDASAQYGLGIALKKGSSSGPWDAYVRLKNLLCMGGNHPDIVSAFYSNRSIERMFQPEPGCSDPTFSGSTADVAGLVAIAINETLRQMPTGREEGGIAFSAPSHARRLKRFDMLTLPKSIQSPTKNYRLRLSEKVLTEARAWVRQNNRIRSSSHETGGLLWGLWDDAVGTIWLFDASGPPPDSKHDPAHFSCGTQGTAEEHLQRIRTSHGTCGFMGFWHTHPDMPSRESMTDVLGMTHLVSSKIGMNQKRAVMLIFGRTGDKPTAGLYVYESQGISKSEELVSLDMAQITLETPVV